MGSNCFRLMVLILLFSACKGEKEEKELVLRFDKKQVIKKSGENCEEEDYDCSIISLEVLDAKGPEPVATNINRAINKHVNNFFSTEEIPPFLPLETRAENFLQDQREAAKSFSEEPAWEAYVNQNIYFRSDSLITVGTTAEIFSGGAHGYKTLTFQNFNSNTGKILKHRDIFHPGFREYAEKIFRREQDIPSTDNINSTGFWFENDRFHLPENIGFSENSLILIYNSYEIAPYAAGDIVIEIPKEEIQTFLKIQ